MGKARKGGTRVGSRKDLALRLCKMALRARHANDLCFDEVKCGASYGYGVTPRVDFVAVAKSWSKMCITGYEVKVDRRDFLGDGKWGNYLNYCHRFYFACPKGLIEPSEVPSPAGLVWCSEKGARVVKATAHAPVDVSWELLYYLVLWRHENPDEETARARRAEAVAAWCNGRHFYDLGHQVDGRLRQVLLDLKAREQNLTERESNVDEALQRARQVEELAKTLGLYSWNFESALRKLSALAAREHVQSDIHVLRKFHDTLGELLSTAQGPCDEGAVVEDALQDYRLEVN